MKDTIAVCQKCKGPITRRKYLSTDKLCGKCYLQKRKDVRDKINKKRKKTGILKKLSGFRQKYLFKGGISDSVPVGSLSYLLHIFPTTDATHRGMFLHKRQKNSI